jgi:hypothetical protein
VFLTALVTPVYSALDARACDIGMTARLDSGLSAQAQFAANLRRFVDAPQRVGAQTHRIALSRGGSLQNAFSQEGAGSLCVALRRKRRARLVKDTLHKRNKFGVMNGVGSKHLLFCGFEADVGFELGVLPPEGVPVNGVVDALKQKLPPGVPVGVAAARLMGPRTSLGVRNQTLSSYSNRGSLSTSSASC